MSLDHLQDRHAGDDPDYLGGELGVAAAFTVAAPRQSGNPWKSDGLHLDWCGRGHLQPMRSAPLAPGSQTLGHGNRSMARCHDGAG